ncbi:MAG: hypothetical protein JSR41_19840 [Proteobacteria bacterium]|nr:hypothetical protein [Pseudomonadota bacterium]
MGYDLNLCSVSDEQLDHLRANTSHTRDFLDGRRPKMISTEKVGSWFSKREVTKEVDVEVGCAWPESEVACTHLYSRGGLYFVINGTTAQVEGVTNFPNVGGRYRGEMLGLAVELGEVALGHAHGFRAAQVAELRAALRGLDVVTVEARARAYAAEMGSDEQELVQDAVADVRTLNEFLDRACGAHLGMMWFWA